MSFKKGHIAWNKGNHTQLNTGRTHFKKGSVSWCKNRKLKSLSEEHKRKIGLKSRGNKFRLGIKHTEEWKRKMSELKKGKRPYIMTDEIRQKLRLVNLGKKHTKETNSKKGAKGSKNPNWRGGITPIYFKIRKSLKYIQWRQDIFIRDNFICQVCGDNSGGNLEAHHKKLFSLLLQEAKECMPLLDWYSACMIYTPLWDINNGITLCKKCHLKTYKKEK